MDPLLAITASKIAKMAAVKAYKDKKVRTSSSSVPFVLSVSATLILLGSTLASSNYLSRSGRSYGLKILLFLTGVSTSISIYFLSKQTHGNSLSVDLVPPDKSSLLNQSYQFNIENFSGNLLDSNKYSLLTGKGTANVVPKPANELSEGENLSSRSNQHRDVETIDAELPSKSFDSIEPYKIDISNMSFESKAQKACYERILPWMQDLFGEAVVRFEDEPLFIVTIGAAVASTRVVPWGENDALVTTRSFVVTDVAVTPELSYYLLRANNGIHFGRFALDSENDIIFEHSLAGSSFNCIDLKHSITTVVRLADDYDDEILAQWGGQRALEQWSAS